MGVRVWWRVMEVEVVVGGLEEVKLEVGVWWWNGGGVVSR